MLKACKKCRRETMKLSLKGDKCLSAKCPVTKRPYAPGDHGQNFRSKLSEYGKQLREKQKARKIYGIGEVQFRNYVTLAEKLTGNKTENIMRLLETRLDNVVYRLGFAASRSEARQMVSHGSFNVNSKKVTIPSYRIKASDIISPKKAERFSERSLNSSLLWLDADSKKLTGTVKHLPSREEIDTPVNENLIIEFYSR
jgi:small subunit ribosomal protein S4